jgi:pyruvate/2-oxoglutarate/acetoin dehydrogenase E1 component
LQIDRHHSIVESLKKTNRILFVDEDVPGGATGFMLNEVINVQGGYRYLDAQPQTLSAQPHLPAYGSDGDYFSKPSAEDVYDRARELCFS